MAIRITTWSMKELAETLKARQMKEFSVDCMIDGPRGNGKSTFIWKLLTSKGAFVPERDIVFSREDVSKKMKEMRFGNIFADEMINSAHNRDFYSGDQKDLIKMMNMYRDHHNFLCGAVPYFYDIDPQIRKFIKLRVTIVKRGLAVLQFSRSALYSNDPWETDINKKIEMSWVNGLKKGKQVRPQFHRLTTFAGYLKFGDLTATAKEKYKAIKVKKRAEMMADKDEKQSEKAKSKYMKLYELLRKGLLTRDDLTKYSFLNGVSYQAIRIALNDMLKNDPEAKPFGEYLLIGRNNGKNSLIMPGLSKSKHNIKII